MYKKKIISDLEYLKRMSKKYGLKAEYVNDFVLRVYSPKFNLDSWLIVDRGKNIELWHQNKKKANNGMVYHLQKRLPKNKKIWTLQRIKRHRIYIINRKYRTNMVDYHLKRNKKIKLR